MTRIFRVLRDYAESLAGRIALLLTLGLAGASIAALFVAEHVRIRALQRLQLERVVASAADMAQRFANNPATTQALLDRHELFGVRNPMRDARFGEADGRLPEMLSDRLGFSARAQVRQITSDCFAEMFRPGNRIAGHSGSPSVECWQVAFNDRNGRRHTIIVDLPALQIPHNGTLDPTYLVLIVLASALVSGFAARLTTVPLRRLTVAAHRFSLSIDPESIPETGPSEVRTALRTFNLMQQRVRGGFRERTQILAAIAHDLQTPLTRLRLRLEHVEDGALREKLVSDIGVMHGLVRDGLELARSSESREAWSVVDIDSLVASLVEDHVETGADILLIRTCNVSARVKPDALTRCLQNLVSNALKYGGGAELSCRLIDGRVEITVSDHGPGFPPNRIQEMFEPFVRNDSSRSRTTGGTGIGLTIARAQAQTFGAVLTLANREGGGAIARLSFPYDGPAAAG